jgi:uracil-DNA glycosylase
MTRSESIEDEISRCRLCAARFAVTATGHEPRPVVWFGRTARILIAGQAPGMKVHGSGKPFTDPSGDRLRNWLGLSDAAFYDRGKVAIVPMAFCFPGYDGRGADLPPPPVCARTWRDRVMAELPDVRLTLVIGAHAMRYHMGAVGSVAEVVADWKARGNALFALPHPSWRNTGWLKRNPWFEADVLPRVRARVKEVLDE